jgi:hypothetical protein
MLLVIVCSVALAWYRDHANQRRIIEKLTDAPVHERLREKITISAQNATAEAMLRMLVEETANIPLEIDPTFCDATVSISSQEVTTDEAIRLILAHANAKYVIHNGTVRVSRK